jgi:ABC-type transport system involved in cytochrome c biogenesis permease subunit
VKRLLPLLILLLGLGFVAKSLVPPGNKPDVAERAALRHPDGKAPANAPDYDLVGFSRLPILANGRIKPLDTVARSTLLQLQSRQRVSTPENSVELVQNPTEWLLDVFFRPEKADAYPTFTIDNAELLTLIGKNEESIRINYASVAKKTLALVGFLPSYHRRFSFADLEPHLQTLDEQAKLAAPVEAQNRTAFQRAVVQLQANVVLYQRLKYSLVSPESADFLGELSTFNKSLEKGVAAVRAKRDGQPHDEALAQQIIDAGQRYLRMSEAANLLAIPPASGQDATTGWKNAGQALLESFQTGRVNPYALTYAGLARTWRAGQPNEFNHIVTLYHDQLAKAFPAVLRKCEAEARFNAAEPFYASMQLYIGAFFLALFSWLKWPDALGRAAFYLVGLAWLLATAGILTRMWLEGRPPVTNLYSSALFIGWGAVALCLVLELVYRNAIGSVAAGTIGFATLLIAHHLSLSGDTLEMMRAVLDSNFWLATHVVVVTTGYSATFLSGFLAIIYVVRGVFTRSLDRPTADALARMVYGIVCFATLFSFTGTVLGGIWADQSWGRFWGWDPKENGALIIVIWNAVILHARWGGMIRQRGLMALAIFGNIVTSWSWFGTNMLGVGLHSYGFTDAAFVALSAFVVSQLALIAIALTPLEKWRSFRTAPAPTEPEHVEVLG